MSCCCEISPRPWSPGDSDSRAERSIYNRPIIRLGVDKAFKSPGVCYGECPGGAPSGSSAFVIAGKRRHLIA